MPFEKRILGSCYYMGGVPVVFEDFCWAWGQMIEFNNDYLVQPGQMIYYDRPRTSLHFAARNYIAANFKGDWVLMLDTDHLFEPDLLFRMLRFMEQLEADMVSAVYVHKGPPYTPVLYNFDEHDEPRQVIDWDRGPTAPPVLVANCAGAGSLLVKRSVFDRIKQEFNELPFNHISELGEDFSFFLRCKRLGIRYRVLLCVESFHLVTTPKTLADYEQFRPGEFKDFQQDA